MSRSLKNTGVLLALALCLSLVLCSCGDSKSSAPASYRDGTYNGRSSDFEADESGNGAGYGEVELTIRDGKISDCSFVLYELDGTVKDDTYGADLSRENRLKAQKAVQSAPKYAALLVEKGSLDQVDAISGATISFNEFKEAVSDALSKAAETK